MPNATLLKPPLRVRGNVLRGFKVHEEEAPKVDGAPHVEDGPGVAVPPANGVDFEAKVIRGYSVITRGEALGHGFWVDSVALNQVVELGNKRNLGVKSRFTHPDISSDGLGKQIGKAKNFRRFGNQVLADLHMLDIAEKTPDGDLSGYTLGLADEAPEDFGTSIVFWHDEKLEDEFRNKHLDDQDRFVSPDPENVHNFRHMRVRELVASDVVDSPAANEGGMFAAFAEGSEIPAMAEAYTDYIFGLSEDKPDALGIGIDPERLKQYLSKFMSRKNLTVNVDQKPEELAMPPEKKEDVTPETKAELSSKEVPAVEPKDIPETYTKEQIAEFATEATAKALKAEGERVDSILAKADEFGLQKLGRKLCSDGKTVEEALGLLKDARIEALEKGAPVSSGPEGSLSSTDEPVEDVDPEVELSEAWAKDKEARSQFDNKEQYGAYRRAVKSGQVKNPHLV